MRVPRWVLAVLLGAALTVGAAVVFGEDTAPTLESCRAALDQTVDIMKEQLRVAADGVNAAKLADVGQTAAAQVAIDKATEGLDVVHDRLAAVKPYIDRCRGEDQ